MVKARTYVEFCAMCQIPLTHTERKVMDKLTDRNGWLPESEYIEEMEKSSAYLTKDQVKLLVLLPKRYKRTTQKQLEKLGHFLAEVYSMNSYSF